MTDSENAVTDSKYNADLSMVIMLRYNLDFSNTSRSPGQPSNQYVQEHSRSII